MFQQLSRRNRMRALLCSSLFLGKERTTWAIYRREYWFADMVQNINDPHNTRSWRCDFRMSIDVFRKLVEMVRPQLERQNTVFRRAVP